MKYLVCITLAFASLALKAQMCTPDTTIKIPGFYPSKLIDGVVGVAYDQTVMVLSFRDTNVLVAGSKQKVTIDSLKLTKVIGLPTGMGYVCYEPRCIYLATAVRCIKLNGTPTQAGVFPLKFAVTVYGKLNGFFPVAQPDTIKNFSITITGKSTNIINNSIDQVNVYPNPVSEILYVAANKNGKFLSEGFPVVTNLLGIELPMRWVKENGIWVANTSCLSAGIYRVSISGLVKQWVKQ